MQALIARAGMTDKEGFSNFVKGFDEAINILQNKKEAKEDNSDVQLLQNSWAVNNQNFGEFGSNDPERLNKSRGF